MKLTDEWFTTVSENENGEPIFITGRDRLSEFRKSGNYNERLEIVWHYEDSILSDDLAKQMEEAQERIRHAVEKDKLAVLTGIYTGNGERCWDFYTRKVQYFCDRLNAALSEMPPLPLNLSAETDPDWEEYLDMYADGDNGN
jgi:hypothetical protein